MSKRYLGILVVLLAAPILIAKEQPISAVITNATYVCVTTYDGDGLNVNVSADDRQALSDVLNAMEKWGHYRIVVDPKQADLMIVLRTGRAVEARVGVQVGLPRGKGVGGGVQNGDPLDRLDVYEASKGTNSIPLWTGREEDGLKAPELSLLKEFRTKVEAAKKKP